MKNIYLLISLLLLPFTVMAQQDLSIKLYAHAALLDSRTLLGFDERSQAIVSFDGPALGFVLENNRGLYQEFELSRLYFRNDEDGPEPSERGSFSLRYEAGYVPPNSQNARMHLRFGLSMRGYLYSYINYTGGQRAFPYQQEGIGLVFSLTPHLLVKATKNLFLDFGPFLDFANFGTRREFDSNPDLDEDQFDSIDFYFSILKPRLRVGIGWRF